MLLANAFNKGGDQLRDNCSDAQYLFFPNIDSRCYFQSQKLVLSESSEGAKTKSFNLPCSSSFFFTIVNTIQGVQCA